MAGDRRDGTRAPRASRDGLTDEDVALVLARAAELDRGGRPDEPRFDDATVEGIAVDAGIDAVAVRRALAELRAGSLGTSVARRGGRIARARSVRVERVVPGPRATVERELRRWLGRQLFAEARTFGDRVRFVRRRGLLVELQRRVDVLGRLELRGVAWIEVAVVDGPGDGDVLVCLEADCATAAGAHRALVVGGGALGAVAAAAVAAGDPTALAAVPVSAAAGAAVGHIAGRSVHTRRSDAVETVLAGRLDRLERR